MYSRYKDIVRAINNAPSKVTGVSFNTECFKSLNLINVNKNSLKSGLMGIFKGINCFVDVEQKVPYIFMYN